MIGRARGHQGRLDVPGGLVRDRIVAGRGFDHQGRRAFDGETVDQSDQGRLLVGRQARVVDGQGDTVQTRLDLKTVARGRDQRRLAAQASGPAHAAGQSQPEQGQGRGGQQPGGQKGFGGTGHGVHSIT
ncbi:hypothetical protein D3C87_1764090 [compost metagenome]